VLARLLTVLPTLLAINPSLSNARAFYFRGSYVVEAGFGHEEWLFNFAWLIDGFHCAFLQPVNRSFKTVTGNPVNFNAPL
jgi:hypothetical protein